MPVRCLVAKKRRNKYETKRAGQQGMRKEGSRKTEQNKHDAAPLVPFIILMLDLVKRGRCEKFIAQHYSHEFILMYQFVSQVSLSETQTNIYIYVNEKEMMRSLDTQQRRDAQIDTRMYVHTMANYVFRGPARSKLPCFLFLFFRLTNLIPGGGV